MQNKIIITDETHPAWATPFEVRTVHCVSWWGSLRCTQDPLQLISGSHHSGRQGRQRARQVHLGHTWSWLYRCILNSVTGDCLPFAIHCLAVEWVLFSYVFIKYFISFVTYWMPGVLRYSFGLLLTHFRHSINNANSWIHISHWRGEKKTM